MIFPIYFQAEDVLGCSHVIVCLGKPNSSKISTLNNENYNNTNFNKNLEYEKESKMAIRNFLFLGFQPLAPGHEFNPSNPHLVRRYYYLLKYPYNHKIAFVFSKISFNKCSKPKFLFSGQLRLYHLTRTTKRCHKISKNTKKIIK